MQQSCAPWLAWTPPQIRAQPSTSPKCLLVACVHFGQLLCAEPWVCCALTQLQPLAQAAQGYLRRSLASVLPSMPCVRPRFKLAPLLHMDHSSGAFVSRCILQQALAHNSHGGVGQQHTLVRAHGLGPCLRPPRHQLVAPSKGLREEVANRRASQLDTPSTEWQVADAPLALSHLPQSVAAVSSKSSTLIVPRAGTPKRGRQAACGAVHHPNKVARASSNTDACAARGATCKACLMAALLLVRHLEVQQALGMVETHWRHTHTCTKMNSTRYTVSVLTGSTALKPCAHDKEPLMRGHMSARTHTYPRT